MASPRLAGICYHAGMRLLATIYDSDDDTLKLSKTCMQRKAARAIVLDDNSRVALMHVSKYGYHKLPGGGIDAGESTQEALARELREEIGCTAKVLEEVGRTDEHWFEDGLFQQSFCYLAKVIGKKGEPQFTEKEVNNGYKIMWVDSVSEAIRIMEQDEPQKHSGHFMRKRDLIFLRKAQELLS